MLWLGLIRTLRETDLDLGFGIELNLNKRHC